MSNSADRKILALHGFAQSDAIFCSKTGGLRKELIKLGYEVCYPCGPVKLKRSDANSFQAETPPVQDIDVYGWYNAKEQNYSIETALESLRDYIIKNGPFVGILGFSQGCALGGYLCTGIRDILGLTEEQQPDLEFFIGFSGYRLPPKELYDRFDQHPPTIPSLHIMGELDTVTEESRVQELYDCFPIESRTLLKHAGGHFVPNSKSFVAKVATWIRALNYLSSASIPPTPNPPQSAEETPALEDELMDIIDSLGTA
ncbi:AER356Cp [Eremothecium gossypii ATCC 10895]|uniref:AER356Cp n=1 Tax=Eremothecium gossypii (strain ATCC 10895 / CBS 109.51 / FGSC 9923 / NRRL Y-1056) TaxID=284811 RepID=Q756B1_EREGS|nr:AER356Cp [Eremothecium gossypii ATCC 10895]AAS53036.1 AER356Cp [Eremothecium gossypii ATCC 10895]AEY97344.1 FAER356Cp [Eremothecium gossypii FDAG1]